MLNLIPENGIDGTKLTNTIESKLNSNCKINSYLYNINFNVYEENLCEMEMKYLFNKVPERKYFFSHHYIHPSRSPFIKHSISILYTGNTLEDVVHKIVTDNLSYEDFKVSYINFNDETISFHEKRKIEYEIGFNIKGEAKMHDPEILLGITQVDDKWIFGKYEANNSAWEMHNRKPYSYSNALNVRVARAIVNIAVGNDLKLKLIDPCCGIGTVVIEALSMGINIKGYEINPMIAENAQKNLEHFEYENVITSGDMHMIKDTFDVSIIDLPYGLFSPTTIDEQLGIIKTARRLSHRSIIISLEDMDEHILACGFQIVDRCHVSKSRFKRYITICK